MVTGKKYSLVFVAVLIIGVLLQAQAAWAGVTQEDDAWVVNDAEGFAPVKYGNINAAREEAKLVAYRDALEKALGAVVTGITEMQNYEAVRDKVFSQSQGIVRSFDIIHEKVDDDLLIIVGVCRVTVAALDGVLGPAVLDALGNPRVLVLIAERIGDQMPFLSTTGAVTLAAFERAGYLLVDPNQARALLNIDPEAAYNNPSQLMDVARTLNADVIILGKAYGSLFAQQRISEQTLFGVKSTVLLKAVLTKTAYQIDSQVIEKRTRGFSVEDGAIRGFQEAIPEAADSIVHKIAYALVSGLNGGIPGMTVRVRLMGVSFEKSESLLEGLRELAGISGGVYDRGFRRGLFEVDVVSEGSVRNVASFLSGRGITINSIEGRIIDGEVIEASVDETKLVPAQTVAAVTVRITNVPSSNEADAIEDALLEMIGEGEFEVQYRDNTLIIQIITAKTARNIASFLSDNGIEITGRVLQYVEGKVIHREIVRDE